MCERYFTVLVSFLAVVYIVNSERQSGLNVDNGFDQTIVHRIVSQKEKRELEDELLNVLELSNRPKRIVRKVLLMRRSAPTFLLNIYQNILSYETELSNDELYNRYYSYTTGFDLDKKYFKIINQSDVIMTFGAHNSHSGNASKHNRGKRIWFDVTEIPREEDLITAELRLYQTLDSKNLGVNNKQYTVTIYRVSRTKDGGRIKHYVDSANTTIDQEGWTTFNISEALKHWANYPKENRGLFLDVRKTKSEHTMRPDDIGIAGVLGVPDKQPFMVGFFKNTRQHNSSFRKRRNIKKKIGSSNFIVPNNPFLDPAAERRVKACKMHSLYVNFKDLQWQDWIIAPEGYDAFYCQGECNFPLNSNMNATNHAIVQTLVHLIKPTKVPKPSCAPTKLSSISVLYFLDDSNVVLKKYKNMVVNSCGCH